VAKVSRDQLKGIVKECLMEILAEGLLHDSSSPRKKAKSHQPRVPSLVETREPAQDKFTAAVDSAVSGLTNDPIMTSIFRDTAMTTLQEQLSGETNPQVSPRTNLVNEKSTPDDLGDLFGDAAGRWADLAFTEKKTMP